MALYTYEQFRQAASSAGLLDGFSQADLSLAKKNPDAGMSLLKYKQDYFNAKNQSLKNTAENAMNQIRSDYGGYTEIGGSMVLNKPSAGSFNYESPYAGRIEELTAALANRKPFTYDAEKDPSFAAQRKAFLRDSKRATGNAVAEASAMTGGLPSSFAVTAGTQAGDYHASQFADKYTDLYNAAYQQYLNEHSMRVSELEALKGAADSDRNFEYTKHMNSFSDADGSGSSYSYGSGSGGSYYPSVNTGSSVKSNVSTLLPAPNSTKKDTVTENDTETESEKNTAAETESTEISDILPKPGDKPVSSVSGNTTATPKEDTASDNTPKTDDTDHSDTGKKTVSDFKNTTLAMQYIDSKINAESGDTDQRPNVIEERDWQRYKQQAANGKLPSGAGSHLKTAVGFNSYEDYLNYLFEFVD